MPYYYMTRSTSLSLSLSLSSIRPPLFTPILPFPETVSLRNATSSKVLRGYIYVNYQVPAGGRPMRRLSMSADARPCVYRAFTSLVAREAREADVNSRQTQRANRSGPSSRSSTPAYRGDLAIDLARVRRLIGLRRSDVVQVYRHISPSHRANITLN